jgi:alpha-tubulin suppressor-like RCC1 family protein
MLRTIVRILSKRQIARCSLALAASMALVACGSGGFEGSAALPAGSSTPTVSVTGATRTIANTLYSYQASVSNATPTAFDWAWGDNTDNGTSNPAQKMWRTLGSFNAQLSANSGTASWAKSQTVTVADPISAGQLHTCAVLPNSTATCWGFNSKGQLGVGNTATLAAPTAVPGLTQVASITGGALHTCALSSAGTVSCWGWNSSGQLGIGSTTDHLTPTAVIGLTDVIALKSNGSSTTCALKSNGTVSCWGSNVYGAIGDGAVSSNNRTLPSNVPNLSEVISLAKGVLHTCALQDDGAMKCWGRNDAGQLGDGTTANRSLATPVLGITDAVSASAGFAHTCVLRANGTVSCWGSNEYGQLGNGSLTDQLTPTAVPGLTGVVAIELGSFHSCALKADATVVCWGDNGSGQLADGTTINRSTPTVVSGLASVAALTAGSGHTCALKTNGTMFCWGGNANGGLGDSSLISKTTVTPVVGGAAFWK